MFIVGLLDIVQHYASSLGRRLALLAIGPGLLSSLGPLVVQRYASSLGCHSAHTRCRWWAYSSPLGRGQGLLIVIGTLPDPTHFHWVLSLLQIFYLYKLIF